MEEMLCTSGAGSCLDVDAILVSIGVNDLGFSDVIMHCAIDTRTFHDCSTYSDFVIDVNERFHRLGVSFDELGACLQAGPLVVRRCTSPSIRMTRSTAAGVAASCARSAAMRVRGHDLGGRLNNDIRSVVAAMAGTTSGDRRRLPRPRLLRRQPMVPRFRTRSKTRATSTARCIRTQSVMATPPAGSSWRLGPVRRTVRP